jgi:CRP-like cAMP-binding protein
MSVTSVAETQAVNEFYAGLSGESRKELEQAEEDFRVPRGYKLIQHGVYPDRLIILISGRVEISVPSAGTDVVLGTAGPGKVFGMRAVVSGELPEINATCLEECDIAVIQGDVFTAILKDNPQMYFAVAKVLSADLKIADQLIRNCARKASSLDRKMV